MVTALMSQVCCSQVPAVLPALPPLRFYQNIPIVSYIFLSGRCGFCTVRISLRYPVIEVIAALSAVMLGTVYEPDWQLAASMLFVCALLTLSLIDIDHQVLPNLLVLPLLWTGLLFNSLSLFVDLHSGCIWRRCRVSCAVVVLPGASYLDGQSGYGPWRFQIICRDWRLAGCADAAVGACHGLWICLAGFGVPYGVSRPGPRRPACLWSLGLRSPER